MRVSSIVLLSLCVSSTVAFLPFGVSKAPRSLFSQPSPNSNPAPSEDKPENAVSLEMKEPTQSEPPKEEPVESAAPPPPPEAKQSPPPQKISHPSDFDRIRSTMNSATPQKKPFQVAAPGNTGGEGGVMFRDFLDRRAAPSPPGNPKGKQGVMFKDFWDRKAAQSPPPSAPAEEESGMNFQGFLDAGNGSGYNKNKWKNG